MKIGNRISAASLRHPVSINRRIDLFLSEHLGDLLDEYKIADRSEYLSVETGFNDQENRMNELETWREEFSGRIISNENRIKRMKIKFGKE